jgi:hypothetical protein
VAVLRRLLRIERRHGEGQVPDLYGRRTARRAEGGNILHQARSTIGLPPSLDGFGRRQEDRILNS